MKKNYLDKITFIFSLIAFLLCFSLFIFITYRSEIYWNGTERNYYFKYIYISLFLTMFWSFVFFLEYRKKAYVILYFSCFVLAFYLFEGYLSFSKSYSNLLKKQIAMYESENNKIFDKRTKYQVLKDEKEKDPGTVLAVFPQSPEVHNEVTELAPLSGISRANTIYGCNENGYFQTYLSDRYGFNNPDNEWDEKTIDYVLIGDSFAHGSCVNRPYDIASNLRQLTRRSVLNLGYGGNGPLSEFATLKEYLNVRMKNIIWIYYAGNDLRDLRKELKIEILKKYIQDEGFKQNLTDRQSQIDQFNYKILEKYSVRDTKRNNFRFSKLVNFIKLVETRKVLSRDIPSFHNKEVDQLIHDYLFKVLRLAKILADKNKSKLYFVYIPHYEKVKKFTHKDTEFNKIESFLRTLGVPSVNIHREMIRVSDNPMSFYPYPFGMPLHFNPKGYRMVSEAIIENTKKK